VWMLLKEHGIKKYSRLVRQNIDQAQYLADLVTQANELELMADVPLNIVCYRYNPGKLPGGVILDDKELNALNKEILMTLHEKGIATPSYTLLNGRYAIRVAICNHRSTREDFDLLVQASIRIGNELTKG
jgi:aromatic-L-amino-acid decarboxylase